MEWAYSAEDTYAKDSNLGPGHGREDSGFDAHDESSSESIGLLELQKQSERKHVAGLDFVPGGVRVSFANSKRAYNFLRPLSISDGLPRLLLSTFELRQ